MLSFEWRFGPAVTETVGALQDIILEIDWMCLGTDHGTGMIYKAAGRTGIPPVKPDQFTPFAELSRSQISNLVWSQIDRAAIEAGLAAESTASAAKAVKAFNF